MKTYHVTIDAVIAAKSKKQADRIAARMLDAAFDALEKSTSKVEEES